MPSDEMDVKITEINKKNLGWTANTCMLQTSHPDYDHKECGTQADEKISLAQTSSGKDEEKAKPKKKHKIREDMIKSKDSGKKLPLEPSEKFSEAVK